MIKSSSTTAEVKCYFCGSVSGTLLVETTEAGTRKRFQPAIADSRYRAEKGKALRCLRCGGPVFIDDVRPVPVPEEPFVFRQRRPRQPKVHTQTAA